MYILFISKTCPFSSAITNEIESRGASAEFRMYDVGKYAPPPSLKVVPTLVVSDTKRVLEGQQIQDFLFRPQTGVLNRSPASSGDSTTTTSTVTGVRGMGSIGSASMGSLDISPITNVGNMPNSMSGGMPPGSQVGNGDRVMPDTIMQTKGEIDLDAFARQREM